MNNMKTSKLARKESLTGFLFCLPSIIGMLVFFVVPFCLCLYMSFTESTGNGKFVGLKNYAEVLKSSAFRLAAGNTMKFIAIAVPAIIVVSLFIALLLYKKLRGYHFFRTLFVFPLVLPTASVVLFFQIIFAETGLLNNVLEFLGIAPAEWINSPNAFYVLVILYIWKNSGYNIILFLSALNAIPKSYYEAADIDGAGKSVQFFKITFPLIMPYTFFITVISIINSFKSFREAFLLFGSHPNKSIYMLQHFMNNNFQNLNYIRLAVGAIMIFIAIFLLILIMFRLRVKSGDTEL